MKGLSLLFSGTKTPGGKWYIGSFCFSSRWYLRTIPSLLLCRLSNGGNVGLTNDGSLSSF